MNKYSVWYIPYSKRYLLTHPWQWFRCAYRCVRDAWRRSVYGWTYGDVWDWDQWFMKTTPNMLRYMADNGSAYPGHPPFDTPERWHDWLHEIADLIETGSEDWQDNHNEYHEAYMKQIIRDWKPWEQDKDGFYHLPPSEESELRKNYVARAEELSKQGEANIRRALTAIGEHFYNMWD